MKRSQERKMENNHLHSDVSLKKTKKTKANSVLRERRIFTPSLRRVGITTAIETIRNKRCLLFWLIKRIWSSVGNHKWLHQQLLLDFFRVFFIVFPFLTGRRCLRKSYPTGRKKKRLEVTIIILFGKL